MLTYNFKCSLSLSLPWIMGLRFGLKSFCSLLCLHNHTQPCFGFHSFSLHKKIWKMCLVRAFWNCPIDRDLRLLQFYRGQKRQFDGRWCLMNFGVCHLVWSGLAWPGLAWPGWWKSRTYKYFPTRIFGLQYWVKYQLLGATKSWGLSFEGFIKLKKIK